MLYKDNITKLMGLEEAIVERVEETSTEHHIYLEMLRKEHPCPRKEQTKSTTIVSRK